MRDLKEGRLAERICIAHHALRGRHFSELTIEVSDLSAERPDVVAELDAELKSAFDPQDADRRAIKNDRDMSRRAAKATAERSCVR